MIYFKDVYASVFGVENKGNYFKARLSTSRKDQNDNYVNSNWNGMFVSKAKDKAGVLSDKSRIKITSGAITNEPYETADGEKKYWVTVKIFDFENLEHSNESNSSSASKKSKKKKSEPVEDIDDEDVPF